MYKCSVRESILYRMLYRFRNWYDIFLISINTNISFQIYHYFIYIYIYIHKNKKERKKPHTFFILVFSFLLPHLFSSFIYFFYCCTSEVFFFFFLTLNIKFATTKKNYIHFYRLMLPIFQRELHPGV